jgi:uncharacterized UBP type Zn finger protein
VCSDYAFSKQEDAGEFLDRVLTKFSKTAATLRHQVESKGDEGDTFVACPVASNFQFDIETSVTCTNCDKVK